MQNRAIPCITMQNHAIPCNTVQYHAIPCHTMQYHAKLCNTMHTMLCHAITCIINNCWRSVPLPCGQYNGHFLYFCSLFVFLSFVCLSSTLYHLFVFFVFLSTLCRFFSFLSYFAWLINQLLTNSYTAKYNHWFEMIIIFQSNKSIFSGEGHSDQD